jgi:hypothetical protein
MVPHVFGWFTMTSVWFILCVQLENAKRDIDEVSDNNIPEWVEATIYGSLLIFMNFAFTQIVFQRGASPFEPPPTRPLGTPVSSTHAFPFALAGLCPGMYWGACARPTLQTPTRVHASAADPLAALPPQARRSRTACSRCSPSSTWAGSS